MRGQLLPGFESLSLRLEQLFSPLVVQTGPEHEELKTIAQNCVTRHHAHHYLGFAQTQWKLSEKETPRRVKPLLYVFRVLLTGIHLMRTGEVQAHLATLNAEAGLSYLDDLIARKTGGAERSTLPDGEHAFFRSEYERLLATLETAHRESGLRDTPDDKAAAQLHDLLIRVRLAYP